MNTATGYVLTPRSPGAVAIIEVHGPLEPITSSLDLPLPAPGTLQLAELTGVDELLLARLDDHRLQFMPHGGLRIVERLLARLVSAGVEMRGEPPVDTRDPMLDALVRRLPQARTDLALNLLLAQPARWRTFTGHWGQEDDQRSERLRRLLDHPLVVLAGRPNIGKSTLLNRLAGRRRVTTDDAPGTTRDHVGVLLDLGGLVVRWVDLPGLHEESTGPESAAIALAEPVIEAADLLVAAADAGTPWPDLPRDPDLRIGLRSDLGPCPEAECICSALHDEGIEELVALLRETLIPRADLECPRPWTFWGTSP